MERKVVSITKWCRIRATDSVCETVAELMMPFARRCAAHLLISNMSRLKARGCIYVHVDADDMEPRWIRLAIAALPCSRWETTVAYDCTTRENVYKISRRKAGRYEKAA